MYSVPRYIPFILQWCDQSRLSSVSLPLKSIHLEIWSLQRELHLYVLHFLGLYGPCKEGAHICLFLLFEDIL